MFVCIKLHHHHNLLIRHLDALSQTLNHKVLARTAAVNIPDILGCALKVTGCVVALGHEDVVLGAVIVRLVERNRRSLYSVSQLVTNV